MSSSLVLILVIIATAQQQPCPIGSQPSFDNTKCLYIGVAPNSFIHASVDCQRIVKAKWNLFSQSQLVSIHSAFENNYDITQAVSVTSNCRYYWIGLTNTGNADRWFWTDDPSMSTFNYKNWDSGYPIPLSGECAVIDSLSSRWQNTNCASSHCYICQFSTAIATCNHDCVNSGCPDNYECLTSTNCCIPLACTHPCTGNIDCPSNYDCNNDCCILTSCPSYAPVVTGPCIDKQCPEGQVCIDDELCCM